MATSAHHVDVPWCIVGGVTILYHTSISMNIAVAYDERTVFGSHGAYAVWTGTAPRSFSIQSSLVGANILEVQFNVAQVEAAYAWTQESPPHCKGLRLPEITSGIFSSSVRIESTDASIPEMTHIQGGRPIQIEMSLSVKECKAI
jgi:hypothetical protein